MRQTTTSAILIPWGQTDWHAAGRYATSTPISINAAGTAQVLRWAGVIAAQGVDVIYGPDLGPGNETAHALAHALNTRCKKTANFEEIDLGLWEGLSPEEFKKRFSKAYKQWREDPASVRPPEGEDLESAVTRLNQHLKKLAHKHPGGCFGAVLGPLAFAALRCRLEGREYQELWSIPVSDPVKYFIDLEEDKAILTRECGHAAQ